MDWLTFAEQLSSFGIGAAAIFLMKHLIEHSLSKDLDQFKAKLQSEHEVAIERLRADLRVASFSQETKVAALHARRAEVIAELYRRLAALHWAFSDLLNPIQIGGHEVHAGKREACAKLGNEFIEFSNLNRIYFDEPFCKRLDKVNNIFKSAWAQFTYRPLTEDKQFPSPDNWLRALEQFEAELPPLRREVEGSLRSLMGVSNEPE